MGTKLLTVHPPSEAAAILGGISVATLIALLKAKGYPYTELKPGATPWGKGRQTWGLTDDQLATIVAGQARRHPLPTASGDGASTAPRIPGLPGHDGKSRLRRGRGAGR